MFSIKISKPHDKFFKETFSHVEVVQDFIIHYVPQAIVNLIDLNSIEPLKDSFINSDLQEKFSDLLFQCTISEEKGYLYFLFEHKSYMSNNTPFQLLKYMVEIWGTKAVKEKADKLPIIIPLVVYHGEHKWNLRTSLGEWITGYDQLPPEVHKYIPNFEYFLHDLTQYKEEDQKMNAMLKIIQLMFRDVFTKDHEAMLGSILRALYYLNDLEDQQTAITFFETWMRYLLYAANTLTETDIHDIIDHVEKTFPEGSDIVMTLAERLEQKGKEEGIKEGKREGATNALVKTSVRLIEKYIAPVPNDIVQQLKQQHISTLEKIIENVYEHKTLEEIKQYLK